MKLNDSELTFVNGGCGNDLPQENDSLRDFFHEGDLFTDRTYLYRIMKTPTSAIEMLNIPVLRFLPGKEDEGVLYKYSKDVLLRLTRL